MYLCIVCGTGGPWTDKRRWITLELRTERKREFHVWTPNICFNKNILNNYNTTFHVTLILQFHFLFLIRTQFHFQNTQTHTNVLRITKPFRMCACCFSLLWTTNTCMSQISLSIIMNKQIYECIFAFIFLVYNFDWLIIDKVKKGDRRI